MAEASIRYCTQCHTAFGSAERFCPHCGGAIVDAADLTDPWIGQMLGGRYLLRKRIGAGGMGEVYEADHVGLDKSVAIKLLLDKFETDREVLARFHREARTASRIGHENIVNITDVGETNSGKAFIAMELLSGEDLARVLRREGQMPIQRAVHIVRQICRGLEAAHAKGIVHRDMKPENVFLVQEAERVDLVKIMDFGISKVIDARDSSVRLTQTGAVVGTPIYMAPEQATASHDVDHRADVYATGVILYELLCGRPPFVGATYLELVTQHLQAPPPPPRQFRPDVPPQLEAVILRALVKDPAQRLSSARELEAGLPLLPGTTPSMVSRAPAYGNPTVPPHVAGPAATAMPTSAFKRRSRTPLVLIGGAAAIAAGLLTYGYLTRSSGAAADGSAPSAKAKPARADSATRAEVGGEPMPPALGGSLDLDSAPRGARAFVDGSPRGPTPLVVADLPPGIHLVRFEVDGYEALEVQKEVRSGVREVFFGALAKRVPGDERPDHSKPGRRDRRIEAASSKTGLEGPEGASKTAPEAAASTGPSGGTAEPGSPPDGPGARSTERPGDRPKSRPDSGGHKTNKGRDAKPNPFLEDDESERRRRPAEEDSELEP